MIEAILILAAAVLIAVLLDKYERPKIEHGRCTNPAQAGFSRYGSAK